MPTMTIEIEIDEDRVRAALGTAGAHWSSNWCRSDLRLPEALTQDVQILDVETGAEYVLTRGHIEDALHALAHDHPRVFAAIVDGTADAPKCDMLVQLAVFQEIRYA